MSDYEIESGHHGEPLPFRIFNEDNEVEAQFRYQSDAEEWLGMLIARRKREDEAESPDPVPRS